MAKFCRKKLPVEFLHDPFLRTNKTPKLSPTNRIKLENGRWKKIPAKAGHNSAPKIGVGEGSGLEKHPLPEMPATHRGVASTKQGKGCLGTPENQGKTKDLEKIKSLRGPKGLQLKNTRPESTMCDFNWSYQILINYLASGTIVKIKSKNPNNCSINFLLTDFKRERPFKINWHLANLLF